MGKNAMALKIIVVKPAESSLLATMKEPTWEAL
jgi:hypothetical protein